MVTIIDKQPGHTEILYCVLHTSKSVQLWRLTNNKIQRYKLLENRQGLENVPTNLYQEYLHAYFNARALCKTKRVVWSWKVENKIIHSLKSRSSTLVIIYSHMRITFHNHELKGYVYKPLIPYSSKLWICTVLKSCYKWNIISGVGAIF